MRISGVKPVTFLVAFTLILLASSIPQAFATTTLAYDNGIWDNLGGNANPYAGVKFSLPTGVSSALLRYVRWTRSYPVYPLEIHITGPDHVTELSGSPIILNGPSPDPAGTGCPVGWPSCNGLDLTSYGFVVTGDFFVIFHSSGNALLETDTGVFAGRLFVGSSLATLAVSGYFPHNALLRVDVDPTGAIPEYPIGLPILAIFMILAYALIRRKTITKQE